MKLVKVGCATLLAFALITPAAHAAWPPKPRDSTPPTVPTGLRVVAATDDSVTVRWNASTDNSGKITEREGVSMTYRYVPAFHSSSGKQSRIRPSSSVRQAESSILQTSCMSSSRSV